MFLKYPNFPKSPSRGKSLPGIKFILNQISKSFVCKYTCIHSNLRKSVKDYKLFHFNVGHNVSKEEQADMEAEPNDKVNYKLRR